MTPTDPRQIGPLPTFSEVVGDASLVSTTRLSGSGPGGRIPLNSESLRNLPSGDIFGLTQNAGMGWDPARSDYPQFLIVSTSGGLRSPDGAPLALGYHTGHWELILLVEEAARTIRDRGAIPFSAFCTDPCDGRSQGTPGMMDSLAYRNDAAIVVRRLIRSLPRRQGVMAIASCDKGLPAMLMALAGSGSLPGIVVPGGVTLPAAGGEDLGTVQTLGARFSHDLISLEYAQEMGCRACGSPGGGCQFLGTAASSQVAAEALGMALPHSALSPSGEQIWLDLAHRSALALIALADSGITMSRILTREAVENAMIVQSAFGGSTNMLLHLTAIAHAAGLKVPTVDDWRRVNSATPRLVDALPNGPENHPTVRVFAAGGVPEVMLHLDSLGLLQRKAVTAAGKTLGDALDWWKESPRRREIRRRLREVEGIEPERVIFPADRARARGISGTMIFPTGNLAPEGSVVKATSIDHSLLDEQMMYRHTGPARVFVSETAAIEAIKSGVVASGDTLVLIGIGPSGTGMEEIYQITSALKFLPWGKTVSVLTDGRFSGVSTGPCIGHIGPEALDNGPIARVRDGDQIEIVLDLKRLEGTVNLIMSDASGNAPDEASDVLARRPPHPGLAPHPLLPEDTRLWALLQRVGGGTWSGAVYDLGALERVISAGLKAPIRTPEED